MRQNRKIPDRILTVFFIISIVIGSYYRNTYIINPNFSGNPVFIKISGARTGGDKVMDLNDESPVKVSTVIMGKSIMAFWLLFGLLNYFLFRFLEGRNYATKFMLIGYIGLTIICLVFLGMHYLFLPDKFFFSVFANIKNFILSPLFTGVIYILTKVMA